MTGFLFDLGLIATLIWIAVRALSDVDMFKSVVLFIAFGLFVALVWVRLSAPDIALAEAAIGAGVAGALMLDAVGHLHDRGMHSSAQDKSAQEVKADA